MARYMFWYPKCNNHLTVVGIHFILRDSEQHTLESYCFQMVFKLLHLYEIEVNVRSTALNMCWISTWNTDVCGWYIPWPLLDMCVKDSHVLLQPITALLIKCEETWAGTNQNVGLTHLPGLVHLTPSSSKSCFNNLHANEYVLPLSQSPRWC